jgi:hypothetical protein
MTSFAYSERANRRLQESEDEGVKEERTKQNKTETSEARYVRLSVSPVQSA